MFDSHDDDLWEVPSIDVDVPVEGVVPAEAAPAAEAEAAAPVEDESSTDGYDQAVAEAPEDDGYDMDGAGWANCSSILPARSCSRT